MKLILYTILILTVSFVHIFSQNDYSDYETILKNVPFNQQGLPGTYSPMITNPEGFDNFHLGTDFGEPHIATNPTDPLNSICAFNINNVHYTLDGYSWKRVNVPFTGFGVLGDPVLTFDSLGNAYYTMLYQNGSTYGVAVAKSTNKGVSWGQYVSAASTTVGLSDKQWIVADATGGPYANRIYLGWRQFGSSGMRFVYSSNGGLNWSSPLTLGGNQGAYVSVGPNGNIPGGHVYFAAVGSGSIVFYRSSDGGNTFSGATNAAFYSTPGNPCAERYTVKGCIRIDAFPRMDADNSYTANRGNVYIVYATNPPGTDITDINFVRSTNYGTTWSAPIRVNDDNTTTDQWMPAISVDKITGKIFVTWYDSRVDPVNNKLSLLYGAVSTNGGVSFEPNNKVSDVPFDPDVMKVNQGTHYYMGDYHGNSAIRNSTYAVWMDGRFGNLGSFVGFYPDYAMTTSINSVNLVNNDSARVVVKIPTLKGNYTGRVKFTASIDTLPLSGNITLSFLNGKDSITTFPDSLTIKVNTIGTVTPKLYRLKILGRGPNGTPAHERIVNLYVNTSVLTIGTNRPNLAEFKVNGTSYTSQQQLVFANGTNVTVQAISPKVVGATRYVFTHWSNNGDTTQVVTINSNLNLTAFYKIQYRLSIVSSIGNTFGGNTFYDSAATFNFGVLSKFKDTNGVTYRFRGWTGSGNGSYTSPDSTGNDTVVTLSITNGIVETARWESLIGINNLTSELPTEYKLHQNYPNPFNPVTNINFDIIKEGNVKIIIYDVQGRVVSILANQDVLPGRYNIQFDAGNYSSGVYFYRLETPGFTDIKKMIIIK